MAKTLQELMQDALGQLHWVILQQQGQIDALKEEIAKLKAESPKT